jgi:hypothetical protein
MAKRTPLLSRTGSKIRVRNRRHVAAVIIVDSTKKVGEIMDQHTRATGRGRPFTHTHTLTRKINVICKTTTHL